MPDRGGAVRPTNARSRRCCATHDPLQLHDVSGRERGFATPRPLSSGTTFSEHSLKAEGHLISFSSY
ncbi:hypothetical protein Y032_0611g644 [Ancylostoma ceylanicum]|uniref:Uncharacterized protein n=1 Tax=Ancylostoma ceylanicum TaxID=53326 RepID=A0A016WKY9_9BILA|nr:hypothetical protein Y032_0611g644 [Ancylostoma ceylanicum]